MAERIDLPDGEWVVFRDTTTMTNRQRRPYMDLIFKMQKGTWRPDDYGLPPGIPIDTSVDIEMPEDERTFILCRLFSWSERDYLDASAQFSDFALAVDIQSREAR